MLGYKRLQINRPFRSRTLDAAPNGLGFKIGLRLIAPLALLFVLNSLDRVNVGFAALQMNSALGFAPEMYGLGVSIFFVGYILLQYPHVQIQRIIGARAWIFGASLAWGAVATAMAFINDATQFYVLRFLLGVTEGGFAPAIIYYLTNWAPRRYRGVAIAGTMMAIPFSVVLGGPFSGWLMTAENPLGLPGWRWLFLAEGLLTVVAAFFMLGIFRNRPEEVKWLSEAEKIFIRGELTREQAEMLQLRVSHPATMMSSSRTWAAALSWFGLMTGGYALMFWLPLAIRQMSLLSDFYVGVFSAFPWAVLGVGMMINAWHSDLSGERFWHFALPCFLAGVCYIGSACAPAGETAFIALIAGAFFMGAAQGVFWTVPPTFLSGSAAPLGFTIINMLGNSAGIITPPIIGWINHQTGSFSIPMYVLAALMMIGALMMPFIARRNRSAERRSETQGRTALAE